MESRPQTAFNQSFSTASKNFETREKALYHNGFLLILTVLALRVLFAEITPSRMVANPRKQTHQERFRLGDWRQLSAAIPSVKPLVVCLLPHKTADGRRRGAKSWVHPGSTITPVRGTLQIRENI